ncbi:MAG: DUF2303 family protein [Rhodosalinus sp.]
MTDTETRPQDAAPQSALDAALTAARLAEPIVHTSDGRAFAILPDGAIAEDVSDPHRLPPYAKARVTVDDAESLIRYANRFAGRRSLLLADFDGLRVTAQLDWHGSNEDSCDPGPCAHTATLKLRESEEFRRWNEVQGALHEQMAFAEFLDENASDITDPEPAVFLEIARDLEATQGVIFKAGTRLQTGERHLTYETETHVKGDMKVPTRFTLSIPLFQGEAPVDIEASFRFRPQQSGLKLGFVWRRVEYQRQAVFAAVAHRVSEATGLPVMLGRTP